MKVLVVTESLRDEKPMFDLLRKAGIKESCVTHILEEVPKSKPSMKSLREFKPTLDGYTSKEDFDYIIASGETAARLVLDKSVVNINKIRGRDFEYAYGVKAKKAKT
jgi:predicted transcriptional regulator